MTDQSPRSTAHALAEYQVAGLAFLKDAVIFTARVLAAAYPTLYEAPGRGDPVELASARQLLDSCGYLVYAIDDHGKQAAVHLRNGYPAKTKYDDDPF
jgi:hypothetical protein